MVVIALRFTSRLLNNVSVEVTPLVRLALLPILLHSNAVTVDYKGLIYFDTDFHHTNCAHFRAHSMR